MPISRKLIKGEDRRAFRGVVNMCGFVANRRHEAGCITPYKMCIPRENFFGADGTTLDFAAIGHKMAHPYHARADGGSSEGHRKCL